MDCMGIITAVAAGASQVRLFFRLQVLHVPTQASQPLMSLFFGNLASSLVNFGIAANATHFDVHNATLIAAANDFRAAAALDASFITYIGLALFLCTYTYMFIWAYTGA
jgi:ATP-binding cassette, subfamily B (MDR/TAP), member 1